MRASATWSCGTARLDMGDLITTWELCANWTRALYVGAAVCRSLIKDQLPAVFGPVQLAFHKHGPHLLATGMQALLDERPDFLCLNTDLINAHNAFDRPVALDWLLRFEGGRVAFLLPFFRSQYASHARLYDRMGVLCTSRTGGAQERPDRHASAAKGSGMGGGKPACPKKTQIHDAVSTRQWIRVGKCALASSQS